MTKLAPEWVRTSDPVIRSPARYRWTTAPARYINGIIFLSHYSDYGYYASATTIRLQTGQYHVTKRTFSDNNNISVINKTQRFSNTHCLMPHVSTNYKT